MSTRRRIGRVLFWIVLVAGAAALAAAQARQPIPLPEPIVVSGADVGFRIEAMQGGAPVGQLVVRIDGKWVEAAFRHNGIVPIGAP
jgi:hypothetical protein